MRRATGWLLATGVAVLAAGMAIAHNQDSAGATPAMLATRGIRVIDVSDSATRITSQEALVDSQTAHHNVLLTPSTPPDARLVRITATHTLAWLVTLHQVTIVRLSTGQSHETALAIVLVNAQNGRWVTWTALSP